MNLDKLNQAMVEAHDQYLANLTESHGAEFAKLTNICARSLSFFDALSTVLERSEIEKQAGELVIAMTKSQSDFLLALYLDAKSVPENDVKSAIEQSRHLLEQIRKIASLELATTKQ